MTTVGVVIPCFDLGEYLTEAVDSVRAQTRPADALVVVDDGSTDEHTLAVLDHLRRDGVTVLRTENRGAPAARNHGIEHLETDYVLCLDADDVLLPEFLAETVAALDAAPDAAIASTHVELVGDARGVWETRGFDPERLLRENCIASASLFRRAAWREAGGYASLPAAQDWDLWLAMVERGWRWTVVPQPLYRYRVRGGSISDEARRRRTPLLRHLISRHSETYGKNWRSVVLGLDADNRALRDLVARHEQDAARRDREILELREALLEAGAEAAPPAPAAPALQTASDDDYTALVRRVRETVSALAGPDDRVAVVSRGDPDLLLLSGCTAWHFPRSSDGSHAGYHPRDSEDAIAALEELKTHEVRFLVFPESELWWLDHYDGLRRYLEQRHPVAVRQPGVGVVFELARELEAHTFSIVICTYRRPELLRRSLRSALEQVYPTERFEVVVVDNNSRDATRDVVEELAREARVAVSYFVEERNGLSHARNCGVLHARGEYVAFLDDDALARTDWLAALNAAVEKHGALVVGGRIVPVFDGGEPPAWSDDRYLRGFFGLDYDDQGKRERSFAIRAPHYVGGGNCAYAKQLFRHLGGFPTELGRDAKTLLAAEETYLHLELDRADVPIYYTDDAVVDHVVAAGRLTTRHLLRKAYWAGASDAIAAALLDGRREPARQVPSALRRAARALAGIPARRGSTLSLACHVARELGFASRALAIAGGLRRLERRDLEQGLAALSREAAAALPAEGPAAAAKPAARPDDQQRPTRAAYASLVEHVVATTVSVTREDSRVLVVSRGDSALASLPQRHGRHFPQDRRGRYAGHYPSDSGEAIRHLEQLRERGADYIVFPATSLWWLEHYRGLAAHLDHNYAAVHRDDGCVVYELAARPLAAVRTKAREAALR